MDNATNETALPSTTGVVDFLAFAPIGGGSAWGMSKDPKKAIEHCKRALRDDWRASGEGYIEMYDITQVDHWYKSAGSPMKGYTKAEPDKRIEVPLLYTVTVDLGKPYKGRTLGGKKR